MNKFYIQSLSILIATLLSLESNSQCVVCVDAPPMITCGETATLTGDGFLVSSYEDNFNNGIGALWSSISTGGTTTSNCTSGSANPTISCAGGGSVPAGDFLWFPSGSQVPRRATTIPIPVPAGGDIIFEYKMEGQGGSCDGPDLIGEGTMLQYNTGSGWIDMPATMFPFNLNPMPYTNKAYFCPTNPQLQTLTSWNQYTIPIPAAAFSASTQFRWQQIFTSGTTWDFWGLDNVNISPAASGGTTYSWTTGGNPPVSGQTLTINPTILTNYTFTYNSSGFTCSTTVAVDVSPPVVNPVIIPNPSNPCPNAIDLNANVSFNTCNYNVYLYDNGGDGWTTVPQTPTSIDNRLQIIVDGVLLNTITMNNGNGPFVYSFPVTDGGTFEAVFLSGGPNPSECAYFVTDNQDNLIEDAAGNYISAMGLITSPSSPFWPVPSTISWPSGGFTVIPSSFGPINTVCPSTNTYTYSWSISPGGSIAGITSPNSQSTGVTTAITQDYQVIATDVNNPGCSSTGLVNVIGSGGNWDFTPIIPDTVCEGDCIDLNFTSSIGSGNYNITIEMIDDNGSSLISETIDNSGLLTTGPNAGNPINLCPTTSASTPFAIFNVTSLVDAGDPNNCEIPITNASQTINYSTIPTVFFNTVSQICLGEDLDLGFTLTGFAPFTITMDDGVNPPFNIQVDANGNDIITGLPPFITQNSLGTITYTITDLSNNYCSTTISGQSSTINVVPPPDAGTLTSSLSICSNDLTIYDLANQITGQDMNGYWLDAGGIPVSPPSSSFNFNSSMPSGNYIYVVASGACPNAQTVVPVNVITEPNTGIINPQSICINNYGGGNLFNLDNLLSGSPAPGTWYENSANVAVNIDPNTYGAGITTFTYEAIGIAPCASATINVDLTINPEPVVASFTSSAPSTTQSFPIGLDITMSAGTAPFNIDIYDDDTPSNTGSILIASGMTGSTSMTPTVIPITTYAISLITDGNGCTTNYPTTIPVSVIPYPIINQFTSITPEICEGSVATIEFNMLQGVVPVTVNYSINGNPYTEILNSTGITSINIPNTNLSFGTNTFSISSIIDINNQPAPNLPNNIQIIYNQNPSGIFSTTTPTVCHNINAILEFNFLSGTPPITVNYRDNGVIMPALTFNSLGNQTYTITPAPLVGNHSYDIIDIVDSKGCTNTINNIENILVLPLPNLDIIISGANPVCVGIPSDLSFPVLSGLAPFDLEVSEGGVLNNLNIDALGLIGGAPYQISPSNTTTYTLISVSDANGCTQNLSNSQTVTVNELPIVNISGSTEICRGENANINFDFSAGLSTWTLSYDIDGIPATPLSLNNTNDSIAVTPNTTSVYTYTNIIDANLCVGNISESITVTVNQLPEIDVSGGGYICDDGSTSDIIFNISSGTPTFNFEYNIGGNTRPVLNSGNQHIISTNEAGIYTATSITDSKGCEGLSITGSAEININPLPEANISADPLSAEMINPKINFVDLSTGHVSGVWNFDNGYTETSNLDEIYYTFNDTGTYQVSLTVETDSGCTDIAWQTIIISPVYTIYIPNSFTPNNDLYNDYFLPIIDGVSEYEFSVYDGLGQRVFITNDFTNNYLSCITNENCSAAWDGKINNGTEYAKKGTYVYKIVLTDIYDKLRVYEGSVILIR